ncbi:MAG: hypothetical protein AABZ44_05735 [Elusimicrobiota bacterium]
MLIDSRNAFENILSESMRGLAREAHDCRSNSNWCRFFEVFWSGLTCFQFW